MIADRHAFDQSRNLQPAPAWAEVWHLWTVIIPRRSITGKLVYGGFGGAVTGGTGSTRNSSSMTNEDRPDTTLDDITGVTEAAFQRARFAALSFARSTMAPAAFGHVIFEATAKTGWTNNRTNRK